MDKKLQIAICDLRFTSEIVPRHSQIVAGWFDFNLAITYDVITRPTPHELLPVVRELIANMKHEDKNH